MSTDVLKSTEQVVVTNENQNVVIRSADPEVIYVPQYEPQMLYDPGYAYSGEPIYYSDPYPSYWYPNVGFWAGAITGAAFAAAVDWDDWGTWGGDVDFDVKREGDKVKIDFGDRTRTIDRGDRNIDRDKLKANRDALRNVDRSNIAGRQHRPLTDFQRPQAEQSQSGQQPKTAANCVGSAAHCGERRPQEHPERSLAAADPRPRPTAQRAGPPRQSISNRTATRKPPSRPSVSRSPNRSNKSVSSRKPGSAKASRPSRPSSMGKPSRGKKSANFSSRGRGSHGGGFSGGRSRGGGGFSRAAVAVERWRSAVAPALIGAG